MAAVFISYAREDLHWVQPIEQVLLEQGHTLWRDQEKVRGGQQWPKVIGEAIAANDFLLLVWSRKSAKSHFVEFEWNTAFALKKTIVPCLLEDLSLPPALAATHAIFLKEFETDFPEILRALEQPVTEGNPELTSKVIEGLEKITGTRPKKVLRAAKAVFEQQSWQVQGNVYQAVGDVNVTIQKPGAKNWLERWQTWVVVLAAFLTVVSLLIDLPRKIPPPDGNNETEGTVLQQPLAGTVWDAQNNPLANVSVYLSDHDTTVTTNDNGKFKFIVSKAPKQELVELVFRTGVCNPGTGGHPGKYLF